MRYGLAHAHVYRIFCNCSSLVNCPTLQSLSLHWVSALISEPRSKGNILQQCVSSSPNSGEFLARPERNPCSSVSWCHHTPHDVHSGACHPHHPHHPHHLQPHHHNTPHVVHSGGSFASLSSSRENTMCTRELSPHPLAFNLGMFSAALRKWVRETDLIELLTPEPIA